MTVTQLRDMPHVLLFKFVTPERICDSRCAQR